MKFHTVIPYKLKRLIPMAMIAGMPVFAASCDKDPPHHDTTYVWGFDNMNNVLPATQIDASADSTLVDHVILLNDGKSWQGAPPRVVLEHVNSILDDIKSDNNQKIRWAGTLESIGISRQSAEAHRDSIALAKLGFKFGKVIYVK